MDSKEASAIENMITVTVIAPQGFEPAGINSGKLNLQVD